MSNVKKYLTLIDIDFVGQLKEADIQIVDSTCDKQAKYKDKYAIYIQLENKKIKNIKCGCGPCNPYAYISLNTVCKILKNENIDKINEENKELRNKYFSILPEDETQFSIQFERIIKLIKKNIS